MITARLVGTDPERVFIVVYNSSGDSWSSGYVVRWDYTTDVDGVGCEKPAAKGAAGVGYMAIAGVAAETIASGAYGLIQIYGYHSGVRIRTRTGGAPAVAAGSALCCASDAAYCFEAVHTSGVTANCYAKGFAFEANATYTTAAKKAFLMCM